MAMGEQRVFSSDGVPWVAQVMTAGGMAVGGKPVYSREGVYFSSIGLEDGETLRADIVAGELNKLDHKALLSVFKGARPAGVFVRLSPTRTRHFEEADAVWRVTDKEGLSWIVRQSPSIKVASDGERSSCMGLEFQCNQDSALYQRVMFSDLQTLHEYHNTFGDEGLVAIAESIKGGFLRKATPLSLRD